MLPTDIAFQGLGRCVGGRRQGSWVPSEVAARCPRQACRSRGRLRRERVSACARARPPPPWPSQRDMEAVVEARTIAWARSIVVGLGLCPFARGALDRACVRVVVSHAESPSTLRAVVAAESDLLATSPRDVIETTLVVAPSFMADDFLAYHHFTSCLEHDFENHPFFSERIMLACFHPLHSWGGPEGEENPAVHYDKRAPYPTINLLRTEQVDQYIDQGLTEGILERNKQTLTKIGEKRLRELYRTLTAPPHDCTGE